jgi:hypothetical protein
VTPGSQADPPVPQEQSPVLATQEVGPSVIVTMPGRAAPLASRAPEVEAAPRVALPMSDPAGIVCLQCVCFSWPLRPKHFYRYVIKMCFLSSCFEYQDLFVGSRIAYPSESYFSRKVMSEVSVSQRRRSPSARSTLPVTRTLTRLQDSVIDIVEKARKSFW